MRNMPAKLLSEEKVIFKKDHVGFDIKETKRNLPMIQCVKFKRHKNILSQLSPFIILRMGHVY